MAINKFLIQGTLLSASSIQKELKRILDRTSLNFEVQGKDLEFVLEAFKTAPYYEEKTKGMAIVKVFKKKTKNYSTHCFYIYREDGTFTDFSYTKMYRKRPDIDDVFNALRYAIDPIISNFRKGFKPFEYKGKWIEDISQVDVDHYDKTFNEFAWEWIRDNGGIELLSQKVNKTVDESTITCFTDESFNDSFRIFHETHTHLRFLPKEINRGSK